MMNPSLVLDLLNLLGVVEADPAVLQGPDVTVVAVLIEGHQHVGVVSCVENLPRAEMDLEDGGASRDG